jgi:hypothetical protein
MVVLGWSPNGERLLVFDNYNSVIWRWDISTQNQRFLIQTNVNDAIWNVIF